MNVVFLMHHEDGGVHPARIAVDMLCGMYGYHLRHIDLVGDMLARSSEPYANLEEAFADPRFAGWEWVFLHPEGRISLDEFHHPKDKVVYVFGSDVTGFRRSAEDLLEQGEVVSLKTSHHQQTGHLVLPCVATVAVHRFYQVDLS